MNLYTARFSYRRDTVFNAETYVRFLEQLLRGYYPTKIFLIADNASYHKKDDVWDLVRSARGYLSLHFLPPYSPDFNPMERMWHHVRMEATHNHYFPTLDELRQVLLATFSRMQSYPEDITGYLHPFICG